MKQTCILVLGMHRSGTSVLTGVLSLLGVYLGSELMEEDYANVKGYFESNALCRINDRLLNQMDSSWDDVFFDEEKISTLKDVDVLKNHIKNEFKCRNIFAIKDPRIVFLFPVYKRVLEELGVYIKIIIPFRNPMEVASSLARRNNFSCEKGTLLWVYHLLLAEKFSRGFERVFIGFNELLSDTGSTVTLISEKIHINFESIYAKNRKQISEFIEPSLKHHNRLIDDLPKNTYKIVREILQLQSEFNDGAIAGKFDRVREEFFRHKKQFYTQEVVTALSDLKITQQNLMETGQVLQQRTEELQQRTEELQQRTEELDKSKQQLNEKEKILYQRSQEIDALTMIYTSKSWKITEALRRINRLFKI